MGGIYLIGTVHKDLNGPRRLKRALNQEQPAILTLEATQAFIELEEKGESSHIIDTLAKNNASEQIVSYFKEIDETANYEYKASKEYVQEKGIQLHLIDDAESDRLRSKYYNKTALEESMLNFEKVIPSLNIMQLNKFRMNKISIIDEFYRFIGLIWGGEYELPFSRSFLESRRNQLGKRDETMANKLVELANNNKDAKIVHIGGLGHLLEDEKGETLYSRLKKEFNPIRATLLDYD